MSSRIGPQTANREIWTESIRADRGLTATDHVTSHVIRRQSLSGIQCLGGVLAATTFTLPDQSETNIKGSDSSSISDVSVAMVTQREPPKASLSTSKPQPETASSRTDIVFGATTALRSNLAPLPRQQEQHPDAPKWSSSEATRVRYPTALVGSALEAHVWRTGDIAPERSAAHLTASIVL